MGVVLTILAILVILIIACNWNSKPVQEEEAEALKKRQLVENCIAIAASNGFTVSRKIEAEGLGFLLAVDDTGKKWMIS